jgi:hypothetical protein
MEEQLTKPQSDAFELLEEESEQLIATLDEATQEQEEFDQLMMAMYGDKGPQTQEEFDQFIIALNAVKARKNNAVPMTPTEDIHKVIGTMVTFPNGKEYFIANGKKIDGDYFLGISMINPTEHTVLKMRIGEDGELQGYEYKGENYQTILNELMDPAKIRKAFTDAQERAITQGTT